MRNTAGSQKIDQNKWELNHRQSLAILNQSLVYKPGNEKLRSPKRTVMTKFYPPSTPVLRSRSLVMGVLIAFVTAWLPIGKVSGQSSGIYESFAILNGTYYDLNANTSNLNIEGLNLGVITNLTLNGGEFKTFRCSQDWITLCFLNYRVYKQGNPPPSFSATGIIYNSDLGLTGSGCGGTDQNQVWVSTTSDINLLTGLTPGTYVLEFYGTADYDVSSVAAGTRFASNGGANYKANFTLSADCVTAFDLTTTGPFSYCAGATTVTPLSAAITTATGSGAASITYEWFSNTVNSTTGPNVTSVQGPTTTTTATTTNSFTPPVASTLWYYAVVTNTDATCNGTSYTTNPVQVTVNPLLPVSVSIVSSDPDNTICTGDAVTFTATPVNGTTYQWQKNGLNIPGETGLTFVTSSLSDGEVISFVASNSNSCATGSPKTSNAIAITVNQNPTLNRGGSLSAICQGGTSIAMGGTVGGGATGGTWSGGAGMWTNANNPSTATYTAGASESGNVILTLTTSGGSCGTTFGTKSITVNQNPTAAAGGLLSAICQGGNSAAMGGTVGGGATGGTWSGGAGSWTNANNPSTAIYTAGASESGNITLTLTTSGGSCVTTFVTKTITVIQNPNANAGGVLSAICQGGTSAGMGGTVGGEATGGTWSGGAGTWTNANNPSTATYTAGASESGNITLTLTTSGGTCGTTFVTKTITVNQNPTATAGGVLSAICQGGTSAAMGGTVGGGATGGTWSGGAGTWTNANNPS
ncbi:MAG: hypothetical protein V4717_00610, partial [Bacteroidota bacterium]